MGSIKKDGQYNKDGLWEYFDEDGKLTKTEEYNNGKLIHVQET